MKTKQKEREYIVEYEFMIGNYSHFHWYDAFQIIKAESAQIAWENVLRTSDYITELKNIKLI